MNITDRAQKVIAEIDAALAVSEKATPGPWADRFNHESAFGPMHQVMTEERPGYCWAINGLGGDMSPADAAFIAASRTLLPTSLRCIKTAIEALLQCLESGLNIEKTRWGNDGDCGASNHATDVTYSADKALSEICDQFENNL